MTERPALIAAVILATTGSAAAAPATPTEAATLFYKAYLAMPSTGGLPDAATQAKLAPLVTDGLRRLLAEADRAEARHQRATKGAEPPMIEGDPFTSLFEGATAFDVGACEELGQSATCAIGLDADDGKGGRVEWTDQAIVVHGADGWRLDNIKYGGTWAFGLHGDLREVLKGVVAAK